MKKLLFASILSFCVAFSFAPNEEFEVQLMSGTADAVQKAMKKFAAANPDTEVSMHATANGYGLRVGGCMEKSQAEALKAKFTKDYPAATVEKCD